MHVSAATSLIDASGCASTPVAGGSALGIPQGGTVDPDGVALMAQPTEEGLDERFVAEKRLPFRVVEV